MSRYYVKFYTLSQRPTANTAREIIVISMLGQRRRRWPSIEITVIKPAVFLMGSLATDCCLNVGKRLVLLGLRRAQFGADAE